MGSQFRSFRQLKKKSELNISKPHQSTKPSEARVAISQSDLPEDLSRLALKPKGKPKGRIGAQKLRENDSLHRP